MTGVSDFCTPPSFSTITSANPGRKSLTGCAKSSNPRSIRIIAAAAVIGFDMEYSLKIVSRFIFFSFSRSARPRSTYKSSSPCCHTPTDAPIVTPFSIASSKTSPTRFIVSAFILFHSISFSAFKQKDYSTSAVFSKSFSTFFLNIFRIALLPGLLFL